MVDRPLDSLTSEEILARIRKHLQTTTRLSPSREDSRTSSREERTSQHSHNSELLEQHLAACDALSHSVGTINLRPPGISNSLIQFVKRILRRLLTWYTRPLHEFHDAVTQALAQVSSEITFLCAQVRQVKERLSLAERAVRQLGQHGEREAGSLELTVTQPCASRDHASDFQSSIDYFMLHRRFRGNEAEVKKKQQVYLQYFKRKKRILDLGCGRGEFLELLQENGIDAQGVDANLDMVFLAKEKGLNVTHEDIFNFLERQPVDSFEGIFCSQVIEHLSWDQLVRLVKQCHLKLLPGSPLVLETINPECLLVFGRSFYLDPTHRQAVHPQLLRFLLKLEGFEPLDVVYLSLVECQLPTREWPGLTTQQNQQWIASLEILNKALFGYQDYAIVAHKRPGSSSV